MTLQAENTWGCLQGADLSGVATSLEAKKEAEGYAALM